MTPAEVAYLNDADRPKDDCEPDIVDAEALLKEARRVYNTGGLKRGSSTGWTKVDELYTVATGQWTVVTGIPQSGKSEWLDALIVNLWRTREWEFAIYSPENYPTSTHLIKLVEKETGKPFNGQGKRDRIAWGEFDVSATDMLSSIYWIEPKLKTPDRLINTALRVKTPGKKLGIILDPWNTLEHERGGKSETDYISLVLTKVTQLARSSNAHIWLVVHPAKIQKDKDGKRPCPTPYDISGSAHWYNKADNIVTVHRNQTDQPHLVELHVQKVRFKHIGHVGRVEMVYDRISGRYTDHVMRDAVTGLVEEYAL
jgi:twinkle protein